MTISALSGPMVVYGQSPYPAIEYNPEAGPSLFFGGVGLLDPRQPFTYVPGQDFGAVTAGFLGAQDVPTLNITPFALSNTAIAPAANVVSGVAMTLVSASSATTGVAVGAAINRSDTGAVVTGLVELDTVASATGTISGNVFTVASGLAGQFTYGMTLSGTGVVAGTYITGYGTISSTVPTFTVSVSQTVASTTIQGANATYPAIASGPSYGIAAFRIPFGSAASIQLWNPQDLSARCVSITGSASATGGNFLVSGYDIYGYPMSQLITATAGATTTNSTKAFKFIASVVPQFTDAHNYSVGTTDIYGLPIRSDLFADVRMSYPGTGATNLITSVTGYTPAVSSTASSTTGDVRGTYALQSASNGTNRLFVAQSPLVYNVGSISGLFGVTQA